MRRFRLILSLGLGAILVAGWFMLGGFGLFGTPHASRPKSLPHGDQEVAYIMPATSGSSWEQFVAGALRVKKRWPGVIVEDRNAFPQESATVPEVALGFQGSPHRLRIRWYKMSSDAGLEKWVSELARRDPAPLAVIGGGSSDRARDLAQALQAHRESWRGPAPLLLITTATADYIDIIPPQQLISLYEGRSYRFCFTNSQMAEAVWDFVWTQDDLRPFSRPNRLLPAELSRGIGDQLSDDDLAGVLAAGGVGHVIGGDFWGCWPGLFWGSPPPQPFLVHIVEWLDDPYSRDLAFQFRSLFARPEGPILPSNSLSVPYSVGGFSTPNPREALVVRKLIDVIPPYPDERFLLILPAADKPVRRVLRSLALSAPREVGNFVVVTGDSIPFTTLYRDRHISWNIQELPFPLVAFCHHNPVAWGDAGPNNPNAPDRPGKHLQSGTDEELLNADIVRLLIEAGFRVDPPPRRSQSALMIPKAEPAAGPPAPPSLIHNADELNAEVKQRRAAYFASDGNRLGGNGEYLVCLRPHVQAGRVMPKATVEIWRRQTLGPDQRSWERIRKFTMEYTDGLREGHHGSP
jgi:hypothetical protein